MTRAEEMAAAIAAAEAEEEVEEAAASYVRPRPPKRPSQVYSVRIPVERLEELRRVADREGMGPSVLIRRWVTERLDAERREVRAEPLVVARSKRTPPGIEVTFHREMSRVLTESRR